MESFKLQHGYDLIYYSKWQKHILFWWRSRKCDEKRKALTYLRILGELQRGRGRDHRKKTWE